METIVDMLIITTLIYSYNETNNEKKSVDNCISLFKTNSDFTSLLSKYPKASVVNFISDKETDVQVGITINDNEKRICVVFRGSNSAKDWYYNLQMKKMFIKQSKYGNIWMHKGYWSQLFMTNLYYRIFTQLQLILNQNPEYKLFITGHSAGGALSTLLGYLLSCDMPAQKIQIVSFASPRIGNYGFKCDFDNKANLSHHRVTNRNDLVTATPLLNYYHCGNKIYLRSKESILCYRSNVWTHSTDSYHANLLDTIYKSKKIHKNNIINANLNCMCLECGLINFENLKFFTPLCIENSQRGALSSLKTSPLMGVLSEERCKPSYSSFIISKKVGCLNEENCVKCENPKST